MKKLVILRRSSQAFFLLLFIYILWSTTYPLRGILPPETFFRTNPSIMIFTSVSERLLLPGLVFALGMLVLALVLGRFYCGWICPLGAAIDLAGSLKKRGKVPGEKANRKIRKIKFFALGGIFIAALAGIQVAWVLDPMGIMARFVSLNLIPTVTLLVNRSFIFLMRDLQLYDALHDLYSALKGTVLGVKVHYFSSSLIIFAVFAAVCAAAVFVSRLWCRALCPLGAMYSLAGRFALLRRVTEGCTDCGICVSDCRMGAIKDDISYVKGECILCMDCVYDCPEHGVRFAFSGKKKKTGTKAAERSGGGLSRREFLLLIISSFFLMGFRWLKKEGTARAVIRPPGALKEAEFLARCIRCGNCMKVCPTNGLQPVMLQTGLEGIWTPHLVPEIGYCEYNCALCGSVCPTGAIPKLAVREKKTKRIGIAAVDKQKCIAWANNAECLVCEEHCPIPEKAIKRDDTIVKGTVIGRPRVEPDLCIGCGICQTKCPVRPVRAIRVKPA